MNKQIMLLTGAKEGMSDADLKQQYLRLMKALMPSGKDHDQRYEERLIKARENLSKLYSIFRQKIKKPTEVRTSRNIRFDINSNSLRLGEMLLEAGELTEEQLANALELQTLSKGPCPLGGLLVKLEYITWNRLAFYLRLQDLLRLHPEHPERMGRQLLDLGLLSPSELEIALLDCETCNCSLAHALSRRGWIKQSLYECLTVQDPSPARPAMLTTA